MTTSQYAPVTQAEWMHHVAELSSRYGAEPLIAMLGAVTSDLTDEARGAAVGIARDYVANVLEARRTRVLSIPDSPLAGS